MYSFHGYYPTGAYMYVRADDQEEANTMFKAALPKALYEKNIKVDGDLVSTISIEKIKPGKQTLLVSDGEY
jgi:hypothetical protein